VIDLIDIVIVAAVLIGLANGYRRGFWLSAAQYAGSNAAGIIMTGMGEDGAEGIGAIKAAGGMTIAQSEETCVVGGMPRAAMMKGFVQKVLPLDTLGAHLISQYGSDRSGSDKQDGSEKSDKGEKVPVSTPRA